MIRGFTNGCFDLFHAGHRHFLLNCMERCDRLTVAINDDASVRRLKGEDRPKRPLAERRKDVFAVLRADDAITVFSFEDQLLDRMAGYDVLFKGADCAGKPITRAPGVSLWLIQMLPGISTTRLINGLHPRV